MNQNQPSEIEELQQLSESVWFDPSSKSFVLIIDRVSITIEMSEFIHICEDIRDAADSLASDPRFLVIASDPEEGPSISYIPDPEDVH